MDANLLLSIYQYIHLVICSIGCSFNMLLLSVALFKTPPVLRAYSILILNFAITDLLLCLDDYFLQQRMVPAGLSVAFFSSGLCHKYGHRVCEIAFAVMLNLIAHSLWSLLFSFSYRLYILSNPAPPIQRLLKILLFCYFPSFIQLLFSLNCYADPDRIREIIAARFPSYNMTDVSITGCTNIFEFPTIYPVLYMTVPITPVYIAIILIRREIIKKLNSQGIKISNKRMKNIHLQLLTVLTYQAMLPGFYAIGVGSYLIGQFGIWNSPLLEYLTFTSFLILPLLSPIFSFMFIRPYRNCVLRPFRSCLPQKIEGFPNSSLNNVSFW